MVERAEEDAKQLAEIHVVGHLLEPQTSTVVQVHGKFCREPLEREREKERERKREREKTKEKGVGLNRERPRNYGENESAKLLR